MMIGTSDGFLRQGSSFELEGVAYTLYQVTGKLKATARGTANDLVWETRAAFESATGLLILPGRAAEIPAYEPQEWDDERLCKAVNYTEADIYAGVSDDLKRAALAKLNQIERLIPDAPGREARDEYSRHKAHITGTMARYAAAMHYLAAGKKNYSEERASSALCDVRAYLALPPGHDGLHSVFHVDPELSDVQMRELAGCYTPAVEVETVSLRRQTEHEYIAGARRLPPKKLAQAVIFYVEALKYQREILGRESAEYEELRSFGPDVVSEATAEKWGGRRDVALDAALRSKRSSIESAKGNIARLTAKIEETREQMKGRTVRATAAKSDDQATLFCWKSP